MLERVPAVESQPCMALKPISPRSARAWALTTHRPQEPPLGCALMALLLATLQAHSPAPQHGPAAHSVLAKLGVMREELQIAKQTGIRGTKKG